MVFELQQKRTLFQKVSDTLGFQTQEVKCIINDKNAPVPKSFFIYDKYLIKQYKRVLGPSNKELIFDAIRLKNENHPYVKNLRIDLDYNLEKFRKIILDCHNLIQIEIFFRFCNELEYEEYLKLIHKQNPKIKISLKGGGGVKFFFCFLPRKRYIFILGRNLKNKFSTPMTPPLNTASCIKLQKNDHFTQMDDVTLKNLNLQSLRVLYYITNDYDINVLEEMKQIQKIEKLKELNFGLKLSLNISSKISLEVGECIGKCQNLIKLSFQIHLNDSQGQNPIEKPYELFKSLRLKNLQNLQYLTLLSNQSIKFDLNEIVEEIVGCQNLIELVLIGFFILNLELFKQKFHQKIRMLNNLKTFYIQLPMKYYLFGIEEIKRKIKTSSLRLVTFMCANEQEFIRKLFQKRIIDVRTYLGY